MPATDSRVFGCSFSPDGKQLATCSGDGVRLWEVESGRALRHLPGVHGRSVAFSPDGQTLAFGNRDSEFYLWETATGLLKNNSRVRDGEVWGLMFATGKNQLLTGAADGVQFWNLEDLAVTGGAMVQLPVRSMVRSPDGATLAVSESVWNMASGIVTLRDATTGELKTSLVRVNTSLSRVAFSPDGELLAVTQFNGEARVYSMKDGAEKLRVKAVRPQGEGVIFSQDGQYLCVFGGGNDAAAVAASRGIRLYRLTDGAEVWRNTAMADCVNAVFSPDGKLLAATDGARNVYLWQVDFAALPARPAAK